MAARKSKILIVEDDRFLREQIWWFLRDKYVVFQAADRDAGEEAIRREKPDLVLLDLHLPPGGDSGAGMSLLREVRKRGLDSAVIIMTGDQKKECALRAIEEGAYDYFRKPMDLAELGMIIHRALEKLRIERENRHLREKLRGENSFQGLIGASGRMREVFDAVCRVADGDATVILRGESGTGKELVARAIHNTSGRREGPFVPVQCSALPEHLIESELFGHERGAFTGAVSSREGRFESAHGGTLFLDEVGTMSPALQAKLLRALEEKEFRRLGGRDTIRTDVRLIAATNEDLEARIREGNFREDLYFRIHVFPIYLPPLRERREDIPLLVDHFLMVFCGAQGVPLKTMSREAMERLTNYTWRGNVRELKNFIQTLVLTTDRDRITASDLPAGLVELTSEEIRRLYETSGDRISLPREVERFESHLLQMALKKAGGIKMEAARLLGIDKNRMMYLCRKHDL